ncbi:Dolichyl-phosphate-mannose-protein mannosyltransferase [Variovorax sp. CF079]|uniref:glycosyltransferase family 39 protein n=1 Tax=Variovorax sp. CF079 TaxID=1882774 RepID=UPI0008911ED6|nr:glycosyltransferase family 39 protein [Variovorax sp. CF079]SDD67291.1 Dolichyl-phosphate-mannose-protein mannosyltransferase [Variovorax sp. CF079]
MIEKSTRPAVLWLLSIVLAALFAAFQIQSSLHSGSLSLPVTYDDVGYFNDALGRLDLLYRNDGWTFLRSFWINPPHAPLQTVLALAGFGLFGPRPWAADAMNALPVSVVLFLFLGFARRSLPLAVAAVLAVALLGFPLLGMLVLEFRPDMLCALLTAIGALIVVADSRWRKGQRAALGATIALFVGALLAKPTLAPVTVAVFGVAVLAVIALHSSSRDDTKRIAWIAVMCGGLGALIVLPYYVAVLPRLIGYISSNAFGANANLWRANIPWSEHVLYYLSGSGGEVAISLGWLALGCATLILALPILIRTRRTALAIFLVALAGYASVTMPAMKSPFLGVIVSAFVLCILAVLIVTLLDRLPRQLSLVAAIALLAFSILMWRPVALALRNAATPANAAQAQHHSRIYAQTAGAIASIPDLERRQLYFPVISQYLNPDNIEFALRRRALPVPGTPRVYLNGDISYHEALLAKSDLVVLFSDESTLPMPWPASSVIRKEIGAAVAASNSFEPVATVDGGLFPGRVIVLKRKGT